MRAVCIEQVALNPLLKKRLFQVHLAWSFQVLVGQEHQGTLTQAYREAMKSHYICAILPSFCFGS